MTPKCKKIIILPLLAMIGLFGVVGQGILSPQRALPTLITDTAPFEEKPVLHLVVKPLDSEESKKFLRSDPLASGYKPFQITLENNSPDPYLITPKSIDLPLVPSKKIAEAVKKSALPGSIGFKLAGLIFWPFSIPGAMHGIKTHQNYQTYKKELSIKTVREEIIPPYSTVNRIFFVEEDSYKEPFTVFLVNQETLESKVFSVKDSEVGEASPILEPLVLPEENYYLTHDK
jgi:hypothetical protein